MAIPIFGQNDSDPQRTRNRAVVEEIFIKATKIKTLAVGLVYFTSEAFQGELGDETSLLGWGIAIAKDILRTGTDMDSVL
jgi:nucleolar MIF4G domain-containing protein 1